MIFRAENDGRRECFSKSRSPGHHPCWSNNYYPSSSCFAVIELFANYRWSNYYCYSCNAAWSSQLPYWSLVTRIRCFLKDSTTLCRRLPSNYHAAKRSSFCSIQAATMRQRCQASPTSLSLILASCQIYAEPTDYSMGQSWRIRDSNEQSGAGADHLCIIASRLRSMPRCDNRLPFFEFQKGSIDNLFMIWELNNV